MLWKEVPTLKTLTLLPTHKCKTTPMYMVKASSDEQGKVELLEHLLQTRSNPL